MAFLGYSSMSTTVKLEKTIQLSPTIKTYKIQKKRGKKLGSITVKI